VRELANAMEYAHIMSAEQAIAPEHLPADVRTPIAGRTPAAIAMAQPEATASAGPKTLEEVEMEYILRVLEKHRGNKPPAANELGIALKTLYNKLAKFEEQRKAAG
jgi:DNA-binding NtrC family response regulator